MRHEFEFLLGERHESPIVLPRLIVNLAEPPAFPRDVPQIPMAQRDLAPLLQRGGQPAQPVRRLGRISKPPGIKVDRLLESPTFDQPAVIRRIMSRQNHRGKLKPVDEQTTDVVCRIINRPHDLVATELTEPIASRVEERVRDPLIVNRLEQPEAAHIRLVERVVLRIVARHDSPNDFAT